MLAIKYCISSSNKIKLPCTFTTSMTSSDKSEKQAEAYLRLSDNKSGYINN